MDLLLRKLLYAGCFMALSLAEASATPLLSEIPPTAMPAVLEVMSKDIADLHIQAGRDINNGRTAYTAVNSGQGLHYRFTDDGLHVESSAASAVRLQLESYGYASDPRPVTGGAKPVIAEGRIDYHFAGLSEWFINSPYGLEHGFTLDSLPVPVQAKTPGESSEVVLQLAYNSELEARVMPGNLGVQFEDSNGIPVYRYSRLAAWDAEGRSLTASMHAEGNRLALHVDVQDAVFPVTVDPLFENETKLTGTFPSAGDNFGYSVAVDGEWMAIGARNGERLAVADTGAVYMFRRIGAQWTQFVPQIGNGILDGNGIVGAFFGHSVAIRRDSVSGNPLLVVGATGENSSSGAVYVYEFGLHCYDSESASFYECWGNKTRLVGGLLADTSDSFGYSVAATEDTIVIGAINDEAPDGIDPATPNTGAVYIFKCTSVNTVSTPYCESWVQQKQLVPSGALGSDRVGYDVDIDGNVIVIGSPLNDSAGSSAGAVYVYRWQFSHFTGAPFFIPVYDWLFEQKITGAAVGDSFGIAVAVSGDELVASAWRADVGGLGNAGTVQVYSWTIANGWTLSDTLAPLQADNTTSDMAIDDRFGTSVDFVTGSYPGQGDYILVGAYRNDDAGNDTGSAYLFKRGASGWQQIKKLTASDGAA
ncbi:MAG: FG-GAP repeat protein, partial [Gammaproteobacteria bacterium]|nr:FG-GAP repeat protein [Gammaproteobacteria bacterium]